MRLALDTNILVYAEGANDRERETAAARLIAALPTGSTYLPAQVLGELFNVLVKRGFSRERARVAAREWSETFPLLETAPALMLIAVDLATERKLKVWDALVLTVAADARCDILLSEDFQDGFAWRGVTVCNPFAASPHPLIADMLSE
jgi:predicted nucleic acid-binding protein